MIAIILEPRVVKLGNERTEFESFHCILCVFSVLNHVFLPLIQLISALEVKFKWYQLNIMRKTS
jgi:hypothetical protein